MPQSLVNLNYHLIFSTKGREPFIDYELQLRLFEYISGLLRAKSFRLLIAGGMPDHVHCLVSLHQGIAVADAVRIVKACTSKWIHETFPRHAGFGWQGGYGAFTVSSSNLSKVESYVLKQSEHHRTVSFQEEYLAFLQRHKISYNEQ